MFAALGLALGAAQDPLLVELRAPRREWYAQEAIPIEVRIGVAQDFLERDLLPPFHRRLDLPLLLEGSWLPAAQPDAGDGFSFALNGAEAWARAGGAESRAGRAWSFYSYSAVLRADQPGELALPAVALRYAVGTGFRDDPIHGRVAAGREDRMIASEPLRLTILPLPVAGRPASFRGAVGRFELEAAAAPLEVAPGETLTLRLSIRGDAPPASWEPPDLGLLPGFELRGQLDDRGSPVRILQYELLLRNADARAVPAIEFAYFDPAPPGGYRIARTEAIPLRVRGAPSQPAAPAAAAVADLRLQEPRASAPPPHRLTSAAFVLALLLPAALTGSFGLFQRRRARDARDPLRVRARRAAAHFQRALARHPERCAAPFAEYLAARLRLPAGAALAPSLESRLLAAGLPRDGAREAAETLADLLAAEYGGPPCADGAARARAQVRRLERHFRAGRPA